MKKFLFAALVLIFSVEAKAASSSFDVAWSTFTNVAVTVTSGTAVIVNSRPAGFKANVGMYRFINQHPTWDLWLGDVNVSTNSRGEKLAAAGGKSEWMVGKDYASSGRLNPIYAVGADSSGFSHTLKLGVIWFGY